MSKLSSILNQRFLKKDKTKTAELAQKAVEGELTGFSGIFALGEKSGEEREALHALLTHYAPEGVLDISSDLDSLTSLTSEVKAINNQAALLHGERILKAQEILKRYREGAFSSWLKATYGNRQTPYNFLQYYQFHQAVPKPLHSHLEKMPRQAIYTLASREGAIDKKEEIIRTYKGERKEDLLVKIRSYFPLEESDKRREDIAKTTLLTLKKLLSTFEMRKVKLTTPQKERLAALLSQLSAHVDSL